MPFSPGLGAALRGPCRWGEGRAAGFEPSGAGNWGQAQPLLFPCAVRGGAPGPSLENQAPSPGSEEGGAEAGPKPEPDGLGRGAEAVTGPSLPGTAGPQAVRQPRCPTLLLTAGAAAGGEQSVGGRLTGLLRGRGLCREGRGRIWGLDSCLLQPQALVPGRPAGRGLPPTQKPPQRGGGTVGGGWGKARASVNPVPGRSGLRLSAGCSPVCGLPSPARHLPGPEREAAPSVCGPAARPAITRLLRDCRSRCGYDSRPPTPPAPPAPALALVSLVCAHGVFAPVLANSGPDALETSHSRKERGFQSCLVCLVFGGWGWQIQGPGTCWRNNS